MLTDYHGAMDHPWLTTDGARGVRVKVKVVPGSSRNRIVGELGDRLKVSVSAPPEGGKANDAVCGLIAGALGVAVRDVSVLDGHGRPQKTIGVTRVSVEQARAALSAACGRA